MLTEINFEDRLDLNREEERVLSTILHPFGDCNHCLFFESTKVVT